MGFKEDMPPASASADALEVGYHADSSQPVATPMVHGAVGTAPGSFALVVDPADATESSAATVRLSYKFQRLREKLRQAIASGELTGRLPGERQLARKFRVNAKTLSKALTDLAAEGLLDRSIGRGTFVKGTEAQTPVSEKWLVICEEEHADAAVVRELLKVNPDAQRVIGLPPQRPSFLNPFKAAVIFSQQVPDAFIRDLIVRNISVVITGREPSTYSTHAVLIDRTHGASCIARELMLAGHRRFIAVEDRSCTQIATAIRQAAARYAPDATVEPAFANEVRAAVEQGATAVICGSFDAANIVHDTFNRMNLEIPARVSLAAVGSGDGECRCSGYFVSPTQKAQAILELLRDGSAKRPLTLWLAAKPVDRGTTGPTESMLDPSVRQRFDGVRA